MEMSLLTESGIKEHRQRIETAIARQEQLKTEHEATRNGIAELQQKIKCNEEENENLKRKIQSLQDEGKAIADEYNPLNHTINDSEKALRDHDYEQQVQDLIGKQDTFYAVVQRVLTKIQRELAEDLSDFVEFVDPAEVVAQMKSHIESRNLGADAAVVREGKVQYDKAIRELCEKKLRKEPIDLTHGALPIDRLKTWLRSKHIIGMWKA
jgi:chromosome segregation ATPase